MGDKPVDVDDKLVQHVYEAALDLNEWDDSEYIAVVEAYHDYDPWPDDPGTLVKAKELPQYRTIVEIEDTTGFSDNTYTYPVAIYAREEWDLFLFDAVSDWDEQTVKLRFGYTPDQ